MKVILSKKSATYIFAASAALVCLIGFFIFIWDLNNIRQAARSGGTQTGSISSSDNLTPEQRLAQLRKMFDAIDANASSSPGLSPKETQAKLNKMFNGIDNASSSITDMTEKDRLAELQKMFSSIHR